MPAEQLPVSCWQTPPDGDAARVNMVLVVQGLTHGACVPFFGRYGPVHVDHLGMLMGFLAWLSVLFASILFAALMAPATKTLACLW